MITLRTALLVCPLLAAPAGAQIVFAPPESHPLTHPLTTTLTGDLDLDGHLDLVANPGNPEPFTSAILSSLLGAGDGAFGPPVGKLVGLSGAGEGHIADVSGTAGGLVPDGLPDVVYGPGAAIAWLGGLGTGAFGSGAGITLSAFQMNTVRAVDLEPDGDLDLVGLEGGFFSTGKLFPLVGLGTGSFSIKSALSAQLGSQSLVLVQLDGDGGLDAVCSNAFSGSLTFWMDDPAGGFLAGTHVAVGGTPRELAVTDLDDDGILDLLVANQSLNAVQVLAGQGDGTFGDPIAHPVSAGPTRLAVSDLDGDGLQDVLLSAAAGSVLVLKGGPDGTLTQVANVSSPLEALGMSLGDLDGDGDLDASVARGGSAGTVDVLINETYPAGSPFTDLGQALAGTTGYPIQLAEGTLVAGEPFGFHLLNAKPAAPAVHVVGLSPLFLPFKGGTLVPAPDLLNVVATDAAGEVHLVGPWPPGGSGLTLWLQFWVHDPGGIKCRAASNAVAASIP